MEHCSRLVRRSPENSFKYRKPVRLADDDRAEEPTRGQERSRLLWKHPDFLKLWLGESVSLVGDQFSGLAIPYAAAVLLSATAFQMGVLSALANLPFLILSLAAGVWADRYRRRRLMILSDLSRALLLLSVPIAYALQSLSIYLLFFVTFTVGIFTVIFDITYQAYLPSLVDRDQLTDANGKLQASAGTASAVGPTAAGGLISLVAAPFAILIDSLSFFWSAANLSLIRRKEDPVPSRDRKPILAEIREGVSVVFHDRRLYSIAGCTATANLSGGMFVAVVVLYGVQVLKMPAWQLGLMFGLGSVGSVSAALVASRLGALFNVGRLIVVSAAIFSLSGVLVIFATPPYGAYFLTGSVFVGGFGAVVYNVNQVSYRQALVPLRLQGRLNATMRFIVTGIIPIGSLIGGEVGQVFGLYPALVASALVGLASFLWVFFSPVRGVKSIPSVPEGE